jgi:small subunit ribosomal protein S1
MNPSDQLEIDDQTTSAADDSFGDILSQFESEHHSEGHLGAPVQGTVVSVTPEAIFVDIGRKTEGILRPETLRGAPLKAGDVVSVNIGVRNEEGYYELSTTHVTQPKDWSAIQAAFDEKRTIAGTVTEVVKGGLRVDIGMRAFMPASRSGARDIPEMERLVGQLIECRITKLDTEKDDIVVDRRVVLEDREKQSREAAFTGLQEGAVIRGTVRNVMDFGAFVDLGGVDGLLHVADMSWTRISKPSDVVKVGDQVEVKVLKVNRETHRVSLGMKQLQPDPWTVAAQKFKVGERARGVVARLQDFGAFVTLEPGVDGLIHVSEMSWSKKIRKPADMLKTGESVEVVILGINAGEKRISLGLKQALGDPWEQVPQKYPVGSVVEATVVSIQNFGAFADLGEGIEGMIHVGDITREKRIEHPREMLKTGDKVKTQVLEIDREKRRIRLGMKQLEPTSADQWIAEHQVGDTVTGRVVEVKGDRAKVELGEGVHGTCKLAVEAPVEAKSKAAAAGDLTSKVAQLSARWKQGAGEGAAASQKPSLKSGQIHNFRIAAADAAQKKIQLEFVS